MSLEKEKGKVHTIGTLDFSRPQLRDAPLSVLRHLKMRHFLLKYLLVILQVVFIHIIHVSMPFGNCL